MGNTTPNLNTHFCVRNIANTTHVWQAGEKWKRICNCGSWINHWRVGVLLTFPNTHPEALLNPGCYVRGCGAPGTVGAHVLEIDGRATQSWKIVPFCKAHNHYRFDKEVFLRKDAILVQASQRDTCFNSIEWHETLILVKILLGDPRKRTLENER